MPTTERVPESTALEDRIAHVFPELSRSQKKLARFVLDNGLFVAFTSTTELGERVGVSAATVVRFCQTLGYVGYPDLQAVVRASLPTYVSRAQQMDRNRDQLDQQQTPSRVFELDIQNLRSTADLVDPSRFAGAVSALAGASDILVVGGGVSAAPALYLAHSLKVMGFDARAALSDGIPLALELVRLKPTSVLVAVSVWRYMVETVKAMESAQKAGATRIAISDSLVSPLAQRADFAFQVATDAAAHALSLTSMMALINAFIAALSFARPEETARALLEVDAAYLQGDLLMTE